VRPHVHPGYEFLYMLEGELEIRHADKTRVLEGGDSVYFDASTPHSYRCAGKTPAKAIIVTMHQQHIQQQPVVQLRAVGPQQAPRSTGTKTEPGFQRPPGQEFSSVSRPAVSLPGNGRG